MLYIYQAIDLKNKRIKGIVDAATLNEAKGLLKDRKLFVISIKAKDTFSLITYLNSFKKGKLSFSNLVDFTRQMGIMNNAGLSLIDSLNIIVSQSADPEQKFVVSKIEDYIKNGSPLSTALKNFPDSFPDYYISLIRAGESSGKLDDIFLRLADNLEKSREFRGKVIGSLIYPLIIIMGLVVVGFIMITFVLPKMLELYKNFNVDLPVSTQFIIAVSNFSAKFWPLIILFTIILAFVIRYYLSIPANKKKAERIILKFPVIGNIVQKSILVETTRTLAILINSGVPILESLSIVKNATENLTYRDAIEQVHNQVEKGETLGEALESREVFPPILIQMAAVGERTGKLDDTLLRLSKYFQSESELAIKAATTLIEPAVLLVLGVGVGFLVVSILTPIYNLTSSFGVAQ